MKKEELVEEVRRLRALLDENRDLPDIASDALRKARARTEEFRTAFGIASDELARTRALLTAAWRELESLEFCVPAFSLYRESYDSEPREGGSGRKRDASDRLTCPACGGFGSHSPGCSLARALSRTGDPRPRRRELEDAADRAWTERTGERDGVRSRLAFLDVLFAELGKWGIIRED